MECSTNAAALRFERELAPATPIVDRPRNDGEPVDNDELRLQELSSRINAARSIY
jgi:hypothetical protein